MKHKCYISYKFEDERYRNKIVDKFGDTHFIDKSQQEEIDSDDPDYIMQKIRELYLKDSSVTIFLIGTRSHENYQEYKDALMGYDSQIIIRREITASLYNGNGNTRNGLLGVVLPEMENAIYGGQTTCPCCGAIVNIVNDILIVLVFVVSEDARAEGDADCKLFPYAVLDCLGLLCRLFLCHAGNESDHHFRCLVERVQVIVLKIDADRWVEVFEYADIANAVHEVPGKTADRLCNDKVDLARLAVLDHAQEFLTLFYRRCGYALVSIDAREFPGRVLTNDSFLVLDLQFKTTLLVLALGTDAAVSAHP